jgi:uncharacterized PurR-regulated membrane protein YhhQ (DUF165 family)
MRFALVSVFAGEVTQQIHSFLASGVMSSQSSDTFLFEIIAFLKSRGRACTVPPEIFFVIKALYQNGRAVREAETLDSKSVNV